MEFIGLFVGLFGCICGGLLYGIIWDYIYIKVVESMEKWEFLWVLASFLCGSRWSSGKFGRGGGCKGF